jgi:hypothetical protein
MGINSIERLCIVEAVVVDLPGCAESGAFPKKNQSQLSKAADWLVFFGDLK